MPDDETRLLAIADLLIPGDARWPAASAALGPDAAACLRGLLPEAPDLAALDAEVLAPALDALYRAYYSTSAVQGVIAALAASGPREASPLFDGSLLAGRSKQKR
jgi:hypothetical protein